MSKPVANNSDAFVTSIDTLIAVADATMAKSRSGAFTVKQQVRAFNDAVRAGVVFG